MINHDDDTEAAPGAPASRGLGFLLPHSPIAEMALCAEMPGPDPVAAFSREAARIQRDAILNGGRAWTEMPARITDAARRMGRELVALDEPATDEAFDAIGARLAALRARAAGGSE